MANSTAGTRKQYKQTGRKFVTASQSLITNAAQTPSPVSLLTSLLNEVGKPTPPKKSQTSPGSHVKKKNEK